MDIIEQDWRSLNDIHIKKTRGKLKSSARIERERANNLIGGSGWLARGSILPRGRCVRDGRSGRVPLEQAQLVNPAVEDSILQFDVDVSYQVVCTWVDFDDTANAPTPFAESSIFLHHDITNFQVPAGDVPFWMNSNWLQVRATPMWPE